MWYSERAIKSGESYLNRLTPKPEVFITKTVDKRVSINYKNLPTGKHGPVCTIPKITIDGVQITVFGCVDDYNVAVGRGSTDFPSDSTV